MPCRCLLPAMLGAWIGLGSISSGQEPIPPDHARRMQAGLALFRSHVRDDLTRHCLDCHGGKATKGDFDLSDRPALLASGAISADAKASRLYALIAHLDEPHMPKKAAKLPAEVIDRVARWIDLGAPYDRPLVDRASGKPKETPKISENDRLFWSFLPLARVTPPSRHESQSPRTAVDAWIEEKLATRKIEPNGPVDRRSLIRRVTFDLIGLPPTIEEVEAFVNDASPDAYAKVVDRLLASPRFGERQARHWMDVARFAESHGYEQDYDRKYAFHYRDFLIRAFNSDMSFDEFLREQLAGDEVAPNDPMAMAATGFLGAGAFPTQLTETEFESARYEELNDMVATTGSAFLGLSVGCARCHDHKYDPIPVEDYYRLAATFTTTIRSEIDLPIGLDGSKQKVQVTAEGFPKTKHHADDRGFPHYYPRTYQLNRGDVRQKKGEAEPGFLQVLVKNSAAVSRWRVEPSASESRASFRRLALANWMVDVENGAGALTARVAVNRLWQHHFGRGIVATPNDFGAQGERPTHPELLDWLAGQLVNEGWRLKPLHRLMVMSEAYQRSDAADDARSRIDPENLLLWRRSPHRLEAEAIHDAMLAVSDRLDGRMFGPGTLDPMMTRRAIYFFIKRSQLIPSMMLFDWPEHLVSIGARTITTTASQALLFLNAPETRRAATGLADRVKDRPEAAREAYRMTLGREPDAAELQLAADFLRVQSEAYEKAGRADHHSLALTDFCQMLIGSSEFLYIP